MKYFIGIDGGGTKTKFLLGDEEGHIISSLTLGSSHYMQIGFDKLREMLKPGIDELIKNIKLSDISHAFLGIAGFGDIEKDSAYIADAVSEAMDLIPFTLANDAENALAGSLAGEAGINIVAGTGSIASAVNGKGQFLRCGGWHHIFGGDEGSAYWLGCRLILEFTRQSDGRKDKSLLYYYLKKVLELDCDSDILIKTIEEMKFERSKIASLARYVYELAVMKEPYALELYQEAAKELALMVLALKKQIDSDRELCVSYSGGVLDNNYFILKPLRMILEKEGLVLQKPVLSPAAGSILLAMKKSALDIDNIIIQNLKASE